MKHSTINAGKNNGYLHLNEEVLNNLENSKIHGTDQNGSIAFKIKKDKMKIQTCNNIKLNLLK